VPAGYARQRERGAVIVALPSVLPAIVAAVRAAGTLHNWAATRPNAQAFTGRGTAYRVRLDDVDALVRHYHRGGFVARVARDSYVRAGEPRPLRELRVSVAVRVAGVPTPEVLAAVVHAHGPLYRGDLATRFVPDSSDLAALTWESARWPEPLRTAAWHAAGVLLRHSFAAGVRHADLNLRNILVTREHARVHALLLDLDRATVAAVDDVARHAMLARFHRSRRKLEAAFGIPVGRADLAAFEAGLNGAEPA
jgi:3-deoxy-D-manno-octulosonic acid kinase